ncbi:hypothetical protein [uncultured Microbulbifer sp.]|uniref:hypothetical protein n=1 Tax=uncultured Microbulbifer sp. TaxID=348147 RepID=UPI00260D641D|nr:hypothetical protein [uncultured Microbulbifer sp.]
MTNYPEPSTQENEPIKETRKEALARLTLLWKTENPEWLSQRQGEWRELSRTAFDDYPKDEKKIIEQYFVHGDLKGVVNASTTLTLAPYIDHVSLLSVFNSALLDANDRRALSTNFLFGGDKYSQLPWFQSHMNLFAENILGKEYRIILERTSVRRVKEISPEATYWCRYFCSSSNLAIQEKRGWQPFYQCIPYFLSSLPYALKESDRKRIKLERLWNSIDECEGKENVPHELNKFIVDLKANKADIMQAWEMGEQRLRTQAGEA